MLDIAKLFVLGLALMCLVGGIIGFKKAQSKASLIAGSVSFVLLAVSYAVANMNPLFGLFGAMVVGLLLDVHFIRSYLKTKRPMPAIPMIVCSTLTSIVTVMAMLTLHVSIGLGG